MSSFQLHSQMSLIILLVSATMLGVTDEAPRSRAVEFIHARPAVGGDAVKPQPLAQRSKARDADQRYLRELANRIEAERMTVHAMMSAPSGHAAHGTAVDPADWDGALDVQQRQAIGLLKHDYGEVFSPVAPKGPARSAQPSAHRTDNDMTEMEDEITGLVTEMRQVVTLSNAAMPHLRRASTRELARRVGQSHAALIRKLGRPTTR